MHCKCGLIVQILVVDETSSIRDFVEENSLVFKTGRGFYEFTKPETISAKKEVMFDQV